MEYLEDARTDIFAHIRLQNKDKGHTRLRTLVISLDTLDGCQINAQNEQIIICSKTECCPSSVFYYKRNWKSFCSESLFPSL